MSNQLPFSIDSFLRPSSSYNFRMTSGLDYDQGFSSWRDLAGRRRCLEQPGGQHPVFHDSLGSARRNVEFWCREHLLMLSQSADKWNAPTRFCLPAGLSVLTLASWLVSPVAGT